jgi:hypothetical protein
MNTDEEDEDDKKKLPGIGVFSTYPLLLNLCSSSSSVLLTGNIDKFFCTFRDLTKRRKYYPQIKKIKKIRR